MKADQKLIITIDEEALQRTVAAVVNRKMQEHDDWFVNELLERTDDSWDDDASAESIAIDYLRHLEAQVRLLGGCMRRWCRCADGDPCDHGYLPADVPADGAALIEAERHRQRYAEKFTADRDDEYTRGQLLDAARCYTTAGTMAGATEQRDGHRVPWGWPNDWDPAWWKPEGHCRESWAGTGPSIRDLVKAGALIAAEIDRLQRAQGQTDDVDVTDHG